MKLSLVTLCLLFAAVSVSQNIATNITASAGETVQKSGVSLQWTLGEFSVQSYRSPGIHFSEGFHQLYSQESSVAISNLQLDEPVSIRPNPVGDFLEVSINHKNELAYRILGSDGRLFKSGRLIRVISLDVSELGSGHYWLELVTVEGKRGIYSFIKENK